MLVTSLLLAALQLGEEAPRNPMCETTPCRQAREFTLQVNGQTVATPYPVSDSPYLVDNAFAVLLRDEVLVLRQQSETLLDAQSRPSFDAASFSISENTPDHSSGNVGEMILSLSLDDDAETSIIRITNYTGQRVAYGVSIISAAGQPYNLVTCPTDHRDSRLFILEGHIFSVFVSEIQFVDNTAGCADYSINDYNILSQE